MRSNISETRAPFFFRSKGFPNELQLFFLFHRHFKSASKLLKTFFFVSQSLTNVLSLPLNSSISSKHVVIAISDLGDRKKKITGSLTLLVQFPHPTQVKAKFPTPRAQEIVKCTGFAQWGMLKFRFDRCISIVNIYIFLFLLAQKFRNIGDHF